MTNQVILLKKMINILSGSSGSSSSCGGSSSSGGGSGSGGSGGSGSSSSGSSCNSSSGWSWSGSCGISSSGGWGWWLNISIFNNTTPFIIFYTPFTIIINKNYCWISSNTTFVT
ncbi:hypothetical protein BCR36DRAFT_366380 [Piromyces finnis]|uniref:Uncharacterized protein n=1 Tax=Piromyces finnis TaxID=1754191 RepID=A0A1Y1VM41_9FUNG|nr:hypothetical protein BCR36DRAFT_366380 [Piromyces finnis]|eukprot:ORX59196.1 hypothetical protein BCR36DRAFT_366380 [Piromyces finnis]